MAETEIRFYTFDKVFKLNDTLNTKDFFNNNETYKIIVVGDKVDVLSKIYLKILQKILIFHKFQAIYYHL